MADEKKLYRSRDSILGGVCTGIAEYFNIDPIVVQILTVVLTLLTAGLLIVAYIALWIILPRTPDPNAPVDVKPQEVHSDMYGHIDYTAVSEDHDKETKGTGNAGSSIPHTSSTGSAHVPPTPPQATTQTQVYAATQPFAPVIPPSPGVPPVGAQTPGEPHFAGQPVSQQAYSASGASTPVTAETPSSKHGSDAANGAFWFGLIVLFVGVCALLGAFVTGVMWWQFWPLLFVIVGIGRMVVPGKKGRRMQHFVSGLIQFSFGVAALPFSLGILSLASLEPIFINLWPVLVIMCGFFILGRAMRAPLFTFAAGLCFVAFCVFGIGWFSFPGPTDMIALNLPTGNEYVYTFDFLQDR